MGNLHLKKTKVKPVILIKASSFALTEHQPAGCLHEHRAETQAHCEYRCSRSSQAKYIPPAQA